MGLSGVVLLHFTRTAAAAHANVLQGATEARRFMALEMVQGYEHIRVHYRPADLGIAHIFAARHRHLHLIVTLDAVGNDDLAPGGHGVKAVDHGCVQMVQPVFAPADIKGVAVGEEGLTAPLLHEIRHGFRPVRPKEGQIARLPEMHFDGYIFFVEVNFAHTCGFHQACQLLLQVFPEIRPKIRPVYLRCHKNSSFSCLLFSWYHISPKKSTPEA